MYISVLSRGGCGFATRRPLNCDRYGFAFSPRLWTIIVRSKVGPSHERNMTEVLLVETRQDDVDASCIRKDKHVKRHAINRLL